MTATYSFHDKLKRFYIGRTISIHVLSIEMDLAQNWCILIDLQLKGEAQKVLVYTALQYCKAHGGLFLVCITQKYPCTLKVLSA